MRLTDQIIVRMSPEEKRHLFAVARSRHMTLSELIRRAGKLCETGAL
ncbi:plasmid mobilization protein [Mesorhizobium huakuii]